MTAHEILLETVRMRGEDPADTAVLADYNAVALIGMNEGQRHICSAITHPTAVDDVVLDASKKFDASDLSNTPQKILAVYEDEECTTPLEWAVTGYNAFVVPDADASATVYVEYAILPSDLVNTYPVGITGHAAGSDATSPTYVPTQYHRSLCYMALSKLCARDGLKNDAMFWESEFYSSLEPLSNIAPQTEVESYYIV